MRRLLCVLCCWLPLVVVAKPDLGERLGPNIAERGSDFYRFERFELASDDQQRHYRIWVGIPKRAAPPSGYPALYLLDGNAVMDALDEVQLAALDRRDPPLLVAIGYASELRFDVVARAYDYTPPAADGQPLRDELAADRRAGGADEFLQLIEQRIKPAVAQLAPVDLQRQMLWGHSYGGLFALHVLFTQPQLFQRYAAADPSLWWQGGLTLREEQVADAASLAGRQLLLMVGDGRRAERAPRPGLDAQTVAKRRAAMASVPADAAWQMVLRLALVPGLQVAYRHFPGLDHGPLLPASLAPALRLASEPLASKGADHEP